MAREIEETLATERVGRGPGVAAGLDRRALRDSDEHASRGLAGEGAADRRADGRTHRAEEGAAQGPAAARARRVVPHQLHAARKSAKRLRYAAELLTDVVPRAAKIVKAAKKEQTVLGDHQDLMVAAEFLRQQGGQAGTRPGHNGFTYGLLMARVEEQAALIRARL